MTTSKQPYGTVLLKAKLILDFLSSSDEPQNLNTIAKHTELTNSTALKILDTLLLIGYVHKNIESKKFSLGQALIKYANKAINQLDIKDIAQPHLEELNKITTETVHLGILEDKNIVYVKKLESKKPVSLYSQVGKIIPLYCSAMGKAILADKPDVEIEQYLGQTTLVQHTANTLTTKNEFIEEISKIRQLGYAFDNSEHENDVFCVGASLSVNEKNYGAISVSVPEYRLTDSFRQELIEAVQKCKSNILADLQS
ncbi:IclR family transcriptional regulator [Litchfieldia salsa]|uniref:DNA-binding transcriptional regulator, IclR family n=1 Tax=Litchfieldia salsa TaxID=930152 RepID=A0A1H0WRV6_9BACI|nr:IclR family transcriptional regulator [Litchfieldia salsa]SDP93444.1 DNA-binding transcriptional regulator, IclR family [Litchfieldia salsa]